MPELQAPKFEVIIVSDYDDGRRYDYNEMVSRVFFGYVYDVALRRNW